MKNKELALKKLEQVKASVTNVKTSAYRSDYSGLDIKFEKLTSLIEELENLISIENETFFNRGYEGI